MTEETDGLGERVYLTDRQTDRDRQKDRRTVARLDYLAIYPLDISRTRAV